MPEEDVRVLVHELQVHQIELEIQNEELKRANAMVEEARNRYADLYEFAPVGYLTLDEKGLVLEANLTIVRQLGIERSSLINYPFPLYIAPVDRSVFSSHLNKVVTSKQRQSCQIGLMAKSGGDYYAFLDSIFVEDSNGNKSCRITVTDITARKKAEDELRRSEHFIQRINDMLPDVLHLFDVVEHRNVYANQQSERLLGYTSEQMKERGAAFFQEVSHPEDVHILIELSEQVGALKDGEIIEKEFRIKHGLSGEYRWLRSQAVVFERTPDGLPRLILCIARDITPNRIADENLRAAERLFREFAENAGAIFWISTPGFDKFLYISPAYERIWQCSCESIMENACLWFEPIHPEDRPLVSEAMKANQEGGSTVEFRIIRPDGSLRWIRNRAFSLGG